MLENTPDASTIGVLFLGSIYRLASCMFASLYNLRLNGGFYVSKVSSKRLAEYKQQCKFSGEAGSACVVRSALAVILHAT